MKLNAAYLSALSTTLACLSASSAALATRFEVVNQTTIAAPIESNADSQSPLQVSQDGRFALFSSEADNLVTGDTHRGNDLFLHDAQTGTLERVSIGSGGLQPNGSIGEIGGMSDDGRYVVFDSDATNLTSNPTYGQHQVYLRDRLTDTTTLLTAFPSGATAFGSSANPRLSADGRYVAFDSYSAMTASDTNGVRDVYRLDRQTGVFELMSIAEDGRLGNAASYEPQISADGSTVIFYTYANNLFDGNAGNFWHIVLRKPASGRTRRVSIMSSGGDLQDYPNMPRGGALSADGRYAVLNTWQPAVSDDNNNQSDGLRFDSSNDSVQRVTLDSSGGEIARGGSVQGISADGQSIVMVSSGANLLPGISEGFQRAYLRRTDTGAVTHVTFRPGAEVWGDEVYSLALSGNAGVVYASSPSDTLVDADRNDFVDVFRRDTTAAAGTRISSAVAQPAAAANGHSGDFIQGFAASGDGRWVVFSSAADNLVPGDTNGVDDVFLRDRQLGTTQRISLTSTGEETFCRSGYPRITPDGRYITFAACAALLPEAGFGFQIYRYDRQLQQLRLVSANASGQPGNAGSIDSSISDDGRFVAFVSWASNLTASDNPGYDIFVRDMDSSLVQLASGGHAGATVQGNRNLAQISGDGRSVLLVSDADNLIPDDTNSTTDVFVYDRVLQTTERVSLSDGGGQLPGGGYSASFTRNGNQVVFSSQDSNWNQHLLLRRRDTQSTTLISLNSAGEPLNYSVYSAQISADGRRVVFMSIANNDGTENEPARPRKLLLRELDLGRTTRIRGFADYDDLVSAPQITADAEHVLFSARANDVVLPDGNNRFRDVFIASGIGDQLFADSFQPLP